MLVNFKKLVSVSATFMLVTKASRKNVVLKRILSIYYLLRFQKDKENERQSLINSGSKMNKMTQAYALKLGLKLRRTDVRAQMIDGSTLETFEMVLASFQLEDSVKRANFF